MSNKLLKCLLIREFYDKYKHKLSSDFFVADPNAKSLFNTLSRAYETINKDLTVDSLRELHYSYNPALSEANKRVLELLFAELNSLDLTNETSELVLKQAIEQHLWTELCNVAIAGTDGLKPDVIKAQRLLDDIKEGINLDRDIKTVTDDIDELLALDEQNQKWKFHLTTLTPIIEGIGPNTFTLIAARTNVGKTGLLVSFIAQPGGFLDQGAHVTYVANEESAYKTKLRMLAAYSGYSKEEIKKRETKEKANEVFEKVRNKLHILDVSNFSIEELDAYLKDKIHPTDILVVDILDKLASKGSSDQAVERLGDLYLSFRELVKRHNIAGIGTCQASIDADNRSVFSMDCLANSKTAKGGELDLCLCLGQKLEGDKTETVWRTLNVAKNKLSGNHEYISFMMDNKLNRITA